MLYRSKGVSPGLTRDLIGKLKVKTLLVDPYTALHLYSGVLPIKSLQLPEWSLRLGLEKMCKYFQEFVPKDLNSVLLMKCE